MTDNLRHYCPEWDDMEININDPEFRACNCFELTEEQKSIVDSAYAEYEKSMEDETLSID